MPGPTGPGRRFYGWRIVAALALTQTASWGILYYAFAVFQVPMRAELGFSTATTAGAFSLAVLLTGVTGVPVGCSVDRYGARGLMTVGSVGSVLVVLAWSRVQTTTGLFAVFAGIGVVSAAVLYEPAFAVVVRWFDLGRGRALLAITVAGGFASTIFLPLSAALVDAVGWRDALVVLAAVLAVTTVLPHALVLRRDPADLGLRPDGAPSARSGPAAPTADAGRPARVGLWSTARWAVRDPVFGWLTLAFTASSLAAVVIVVHLVPYLLEQGHSATFAAASTGALGALSVTGRLVVTVAARRWPTAWVAASAFAVQAVAVGVLAGTGSSTVAALAFVVLFGLGFGVGTIARPALYAQAYGIRDFATLSALGGVAFTAAKTVGPISAGLTRSVTGSYQPVLLALVVVCSVAAAALVRSSLLPRPPLDVRPAATGVNVAVPPRGGSARR